jgi:hypothetical protein
MRSICTLILLAASATAQVVRPVQHTNGVVVSPTNFWSADAARARSELGLGPLATASNLALTNVTGLQMALDGKLATNGSAAGLTNFPTLNQNTTGTAGNVTGVVSLAHGGTGTTNEAAARSALGLGASWLTNTSREGLQTDLWTTNRAIYGSVQSIGEIVYYPVVASWLTGTWVSSLPLNVADPVGPGLPSYKAMTRTNLGLGANWLTNTNAVDFRAAIGLAGSGFASFNSGSSGNSASGEYAATVGGALNTASGNYSFAAGRNAKATNQGAFVWADSQTGNFSSTNSNSFNVRASGGLILDLATTGIVFRSGVDQTRTNLGLGATWLTNNNSASAAAALGQQLSTPIFLRTSSRDTSSNNAGGIVSALSFDGLHWSATRNYPIFPVFSRDASTIWHSNRWVSVYTDAFNSTNKTFGIATSTNLLSWQTNFSVTLTGTNATGTARNVWAPEWFVDGTNYYVLVRLSLSTNNNYGPPGVGWMRALDPGTWTNWTAWTPFDATIRTDANDFYIVKKDNLYWLFSHGGTHLSGSQPAGSNVVNNITLQYSTNPFGNYSPMVEITEPLRAIIRPGNGSAFFEGPSVVNIEGPRWRLYFQDGLDNSAWCVDSFDDFATWNTNTLRRLQYSGFDGSGHGTVLRIDTINQVGIRQAVLALGTGPTIGGSWLTNTNVTNFRTDIGALATNGSAAGLTNFPTLNQNTTGTASNVTGVVALANGGTGATDAATTRTNLGLPLDALTNNNVVNFRTAIGLGEINNVEFRTLILGDTTNTLGGIYDFYAPVAKFDEIDISGYGLGVDEAGRFTLYGGGMFFANATNAAATRTNLGLGAAWLTNSTAPLFWASVPASPTNSGTAGQIAYSNNHLYICISNNTWRRVQLGTW